MRMPPSWRYGMHCCRYYRPLAVPEGGWEATPRLHATPQRTKPSSCHPRWVQRAFWALWGWWAVAITATQTTCQCPSDQGSYGWQSELVACLIPPCLGKQQSGFLENGITVQNGAADCSTCNHAKLTLWLGCVGWSGTCCRIRMHMAYFDQISMSGPQRGVGYSRYWSFRAKIWLQLPSRTKQPRQLGTHYHVPSCLVHMQLARSTWDSTFSQQVAAVTSAAEEPASTRGFTRTAVCRGPKWWKKLHTFRLTASAVARFDGQPKHFLQDTQGPFLLNSDPSPI